jgi:nicotinamidase-related amidase
VTVKRRCSAFHGTELEVELKAAGVSHLIICGMQTETCVDSAVRAAVERGYRVTLVADGHTTGDTAVLEARRIIEHHNRTLAGLFAEVTPSALIRFSRTPDREGS